MNEVIVTCGCGDTDQFVKDAYKLLFPRKKFPRLISGKEAIKMQIHSFDKSWQAYLQALVKTSDKFAFYINNEELWDLLEGVQVC